MGAATRRLRIAQVAPPVERVPPAAYGGTERVVDELTRQLVERGHDVALFASGDSDVPARLIPTVERALRPAGIESDAGGWFATTVKMVVEQASEFDIVHSHLEWWSIPLSRLVPIPTVATFHGRLDLPWADRLLRDAPDGMVAISRHQASTHPDVPWTIIHNGLTLDRAPFLDEPGDAFCFVGRVDAEKGIIEAIDIALRAGRRLRIAAKVGNLARQRDYYESVFRPALQRAGRSVEYLGELQPAERDQLFAESYATLMPGAWPEPFGLVSIESLACGTPVLARRVGALPEIIREGVDGYFGDDAVAMAFFADRLGTLDRREIRERVIERFSAARMADRYEELYVRMIDAAAREEGGRERTPNAAEVEEALAVQLPSEVTEPADAELPEATNAAAEAGETIEPEIVAGPEPIAEAPVPVAEEQGAVEAVLEEPEAREAFAAAVEPAAPELGSIEAAAEEPDAVEAVSEDQGPIEALAEEPEPVASEPESIEAAAEEPEAIEGLAQEPEPVASEPESIEAAAEEPEPIHALTDEPEPVTLEHESIETAPEAPEPVEALAEEPEPVATGAESIEAAADEPRPVEAVSEEPEPVETLAGEQGEPVAEEAAALDAVAEAPELAEPEAGIEEPSAARIAAIASGAAAEVEQAPIRTEPALEHVAAPSLQASVVDVLVAEPEESPEASEPIAEPAASRTAVSALDAASPSPARPPIAVGPGPAPTPPEPAAPPKPAVPPAAPAPPVQPAAAKPAAKRPSRSISIFTRTWSSGSGKAADSRRRDRT